MKSIRSRRSKLWVTLAISLLFLGCWTPGNVKELSETYTTVWGRLVAPPKIESYRLFLYIQKDPEEGQTSGEVIVCVAENRHKEDILKNLLSSVVESNKPMYLLGAPIKGQWQEYAEGVDFEVAAVGYYNPAAQKYQMVVTTYGTRVADIMRSVSWTEFMKTIGKKAVDSAL